MICPDCGKDIGRFQAATDIGVPRKNSDGVTAEKRASYEHIKCPDSGRAILPETAPPGRKVPGLKKWKTKKATPQKVKEYAEATRS